MSGSELGRVWGIAVDRLGVENLLRLRESQRLASLVAKEHGSVETGAIPYMVTGPALDVNTLLGTYKLSASVTHHLSGFIMFGIWRHDETNSMGTGDETDAI